MSECVDERMTEGKGRRGNRTLNNELRTVTTFMLVVGLLADVE